MLRIELNLGHTELVQLRQNLKRFRGNGIITSKTSPALIADFTQILDQEICAGFWRL